MQGLLGSAELRREQILNEWFFGFNTSALSSRDDLPHPVTLGCLAIQGLRHCTGTLMGGDSPQPSAFPSESPLTGGGLRTQGQDARASG